MGRSGAGCEDLHRRHKDVTSLHRSSRHYQPLPTSLGGFSVTIRQPGGYAAPGQVSNTYAAPLFRVGQTPRCIFPTDRSSPLWPDCITTEITLQIPFEVTPLVPGDLSVTDNGTESVHIPLNPLSDNIHVLTDCDNKGVRTLSPMVCSAEVTHANGVPVSIDFPAQAGETVVVYAVGLGATTPAVSTGAASPSPAPVVAPPAIADDTLKIQFDFRPNAASAWPFTGSGSAGPPPAAPLFAGLTPGAVGLYQINVKLPDTFPAIPPCAFHSPSQPLSAVVRTNLTIDIGGQTFFDGAALCVQPPQ